MTTLVSNPQQRLLFRALIVTLTLLVFVSGLAVGLAIRQFNAGAAPGDITACVHNFSGAVRMSPYGAPNCSPGETQVTWAGMDTTGLQDTYSLGVSESVQPGVTGVALVSCDPGDVRTGGGFAVGDMSPITIHTSAPGNMPETWVATGTNTGGSAEDLFVYVVCATQ